MEGAQEVGVELIAQVVVVLVLACTDYTYAMAQFCCLEECKPTYHNQYNYEETC